MPTVAPGQIFDRYRILRCLGSSVSGESYEAEDTALLRKVTLKLIHPQALLPDSSRRQFFREMQGISGLHHTLLAPVLDYGEIDGRLYVARRFVSNGSLLSSEGRLWFRPPFSITDAIQYARQLAQVLHYIHTRGYVHGAVTLSNVLVARGPNLYNDPDYSPFLLADTGLAQFVRRFGTQSQPPLTVSAAPEQLGKRVLPASDQYALAVLFYSWLAGRPPFVGDPAEIQQLKLTESIPQLSTFNTLITLEQDGVILRALSVSPEDRYPTVLAFADALRATLKPTTSPLTMSATPATPTEVPAIESRPEEPKTVEPEPVQPIPTTEHDEEVIGVVSEEPQPMQVEAALSDLPDTPEPSFEQLEEQPALSTESSQEEQPQTEESSQQEEQPQQDEQPQAEEAEQQEAPEESEQPEQPEQPEQTEQPDQFEQPGQPIEVPDTEQPVPPQRSQITEPIYFARVVITSPYSEEPYEYVLHSEEITIGRAGSSDILLDHDNLTSRHHALLRYEPQGYLVYDRRSANGVFVNGQRIDEDEGCELADGDHISIGNYELIFRTTQQHADHAQNASSQQASPAYEETHLERIS
jgi:serine/threonine protein kinase